MCFEGSVKKRKKILDWMKLLLAKNFKKHKMNSMMINLFNKCEINDECRASGTSSIKTNFDLPSLQSVTRKTYCSLKEQHM